MVQTTQAVGAAAGAERHISAGELKSKTLSSDEFRGIWEVQSDKHTHYAPGYGVTHREGNAGFADLDLQTSGASPTAIEGWARYEVYRDSNKEELVAISSTWDLATLRTDTNENKTDKTMIPLQKPGAGEDGHVVLAVKAKSGSDGATVGPSNSSVDVGMPYTQFTR